MNKRSVYWVIGLSTIVLGCRQNVNPSIPLSPISAFGGSTRVPPPGTGSYSVPGGYYQGQAAAPSTSTSRLAASEPVNEQNLDLPSPTLPLWTGSSPRYAGTMPGEPNSDFASAVGSGVLPVSSSSGDMRPQLRGMQVVDLTKPSSPSNAALQPILPPSLEDFAQTSAKSTGVAASNPSRNANNSFESVGASGIRPASALTDRPSTSAAPNPSSSASGTFTAQAATTVQPSSTVQARSSSQSPSTAPLQWRRPEQ